MTAAKKEAPYRIIPLRPFRTTPGVRFDLVPRRILRRIDAVDRVIHASDAVSPGPVGDVARPWYMHPSQKDHLLVLHGSRTVELFWPPSGKTDVFFISASRIDQNGSLAYDGPAMLAWDRRVFHRIRSDKREGSSSLNFAVRYKGVDIDANFSIYDLDPVTGAFRVLREGRLDQV